MPRRSHILYLVHRFPYPPDKGDRIRTFHIIQHLSETCDLAVATLADEPVGPEQIRALGRFCHRLQVVGMRKPVRFARGLGSLLAGRSISQGMFASTRLRSTVGRWAAERPFDRVLLSASSMVPYLNLPELRDVPAVVDLIDVDSEKWRSYAAAARGPRRWLYGQEYRRLRRLECEMPPSVQAVTLVSRQETEVYEQIRSDYFAGREQTGMPPAHAVTNGVDLEYFKPAPDPQRPACVFVGAMDYPPNVDAIVWFCRDVWPRLRQCVPQASLAIVGRNPTPAVRRLAHLPGVTATGAVPDVRPYLQEAAVAIAPLCIARGIQNKVLEAMAMGRPVVASREALEGLSVAVGREVLAAEGADEWIGCLQAILVDSHRRELVGQAARAYTAMHHDWRACLEPLTELLHVGPSSRRASHVPFCVS